MSGVTTTGGVGGLAALQGKIEFVDDTLTLNEEFKKNVAIPYFKDIYKDLVQWSDNKVKGINKVSILTVSKHFLTPFFTLKLSHYANPLNLILMSLSIVLSTSRYHRREILLSTGFEW